MNGCALLHLFFIKWRADQGEYEWQSAYPIDLVQYLAARLWYERELVHQACRDGLAIDGNLAAINGEIEKRRDPSMQTATTGRATLWGHRSAAWRLVLLARALELEPTLLTETRDETLRTLLDWMDGFPQSAHGPVWLKAFEAGYQDQLLEKLRFKIGRFNEFPPSRSLAEATGRKQRLRSR